MDLVLNVVSFQNRKLNILQWSVNEHNFIIVRKRLELEKKEIIDYFKELQEQGLIKSIGRPKNKQMQKGLDELIKAKRIIKESITKIRTIYR